MMKVSSSFPPLFFFLSFYSWAQYCVIWIISLVSLDQFFYVTFQPLAHHQPTGPWRGAVGETALKLCSTAQQQLRYECDINTVLNKNTNHTIVEATMEKVNSFPARLNTNSSLILIHEHPTGCCVAEVHAQWSAPLSLEVCIACLFHLCLCKSLSLYIYCHICLILVTSELSSCIQTSDFFCLLHKLLALDVSSQPPRSLKDVPQWTSSHSCPLVVFFWPPFPLSLV